MTLASRSGRRLAMILTSIGLAAVVASSSVLAGTPVTNGYRDHAYGGSAFRPSGDKPQSKLWYTDEGGAAVQWWAGMFDTGNSAFRIFKLSGDKSDWTGTPTIVDARDNSHGDYLWDESANTLYVASVAMPNTSDPFAVPATPDGIRVFKYSYDNATDTYTAAAGFPKTIQNTSSTASPQFRGGSWTVTIAKDSSDRLWLAWPKVNDVLYSTSIDDGVTWTDPAVIPTQGGNTINTGTLSHSDSAAVIAFGNGSPNTVGVMWSDQDGMKDGVADLPANGYYFATIAAGADPTVAGNWTMVELPKLAGLTNDESDNHINMKATSDGRLFMVGKARTDTVACATNKQRPLVPFFARTAGGAWSTHLAGTVGDCNTRPQIAISEQLDVAYLVMTSPNGGGTVYTKSAPLSGADAFDFRGAADQTIQRGTPFIKSATETLIDDATTTKQVVTAASGIVVNANNLTSSAGGNIKVYLHNFMTIPATDATDPTGSVTINGGAATTSNAAVSVAVPATDTGGSGVSLVRLSNAADMSGSTTFAYTTPIAWTLTAGLGVKTVYAQWRDAAGNWSATASDDITVTSDATAPSTPSVLSHSICCSAATGFPVRLTWTASTDNVAVDHYEVWQSVNGGAYTKIGEPTTTSLSLALSHSSMTYRFRVRAFDAAGNMSTFRYGSTFRTISYSESSSAVKYTGSWGLTTSATFMGGKARYSVSAGSSASVTFLGNRVAWMSATGPNMGSARVYINGALTSTVNLFSTTPAARKLVFTRTWSTTATRTIRIVVVGTAGHPRVILDQIYVLR